MRRVIKKLKYGWHCIPCKSDMSGRQEAPVHMRFVHGVPEEFIQEDPKTGDYFDTRDEGMPGRMRSSGQ